MQNGAERENREAAAKCRFIGTRFTKLRGRRLAIPPLFREALGSEVLITVGRTKRELYIFPRDEGFAFLEMVAEARPGAQRIFHANAELVALDGAHELTIPGPLLQLVPLGPDVAVLGLGATLAVMNRDAWLQRQRELLRQESPAHL